MVKTPRREGLFRSLGSLMTDQLLLMRQELQQWIMDGQHYDSMSEEGRSHSSELLVDPHLSLEVVTKILIKRGKLPQPDLDDYLASQPKTKSRIVFKPRH